ncbi:amidase, partial [Aureobasidium melanogenum]
MQLDQTYRETRTLKGPLHGLPVSFMDRFRIAGRQTAAGYVSWLGPTEVSTSESLMVRHLRALGAIPFCKTNTPQSMMLAETTNNIHGSTHNPYNSILSSGGAAGGEGALLAMKGSPIGLGTEFAGSTRIPAVLNGLYSLKVSSGRLPIYGVAAARTSLPARNSTIAIISWDFALLQLSAKLSLGISNFQEDPGFLDMPWMQSKIRELSTRRPVFAVLESDGSVQPQPPIRRALRNTIQVLRSAGYQVIDWKPPEHAPAVETYFKIIGADGAQATREHIKASGEPPVPRLKNWYESPPPQPLPLPEYLALLESQENYQAEYQAYWRSTSNLVLSKLPVDGVILPVCADAACFENTLTYFGYSAIVNVLDFTAVTFPAGYIDMDMDPRPSSFAALSKEDEAVHQSSPAEATAVPGMLLPNLNPARLQGVQSAASWQL